MKTDLWTTLDDIYLTQEEKEEEFRAWAGEMERRHLKPIDLFWTVVTLATFAAIGVTLAWRG
jgi:hypothetical protein